MPVRTTAVLARKLPIRSWRYVVHAAGRSAREAASSRLFLSMDFGGNPLAHVVFDPRCRLRARSRGMRNTAARWFIPVTSIAMLPRFSRVARHRRRRSFRRLTPAADELVFRCFSLVCSAGRHHSRVDSHRSTTSLKGWFCPARQRYRVFAKARTFAGHPRIGTQTLCLHDIKQAAALAVLTQLTTNSPLRSANPSSDACMSSRSSPAS